MAEDYNAMTDEQLFFDFGPKIFMEVKADGTLAIVADAHRYLPVESWGAWLYLGGVSSERSGGVGNYSPDVPALEFPVIVSDDNLAHFKLNKKRDTLERMSP